MGPRRPHLDAGISVLPVRKKDLLHPEGDRQVPGIPPTGGGWEKRGASIPQSPVAVSIWGSEADGLILSQDGFQQGNPSIKFAFQKEHSAHRRGSKSKEGKICDRKSQPEAVGATPRLWDEELSSSSDAGGRKKV